MKRFERESLTGAERDVWTATYGAAFVRDAWGLADALHPFRSPVDVAREHPSVAEVAVSMADEAVESLRRHARNTP